MCFKYKCSSASYNWSNISFKTPSRSIEHRNNKSKINNALISVVDLSSNEKDIVRHDVNLDKNNNKCVHKETDENQPKLSNTNSEDIKETFTHQSSSLDVITMILQWSKHNSHILHTSPSNQKQDKNVYFCSVRPHPRRVQGIPWEYLNKEHYRLISYRNYPRDSTISAIKLAQRGFAYLSNNTVVCCFCGITAKVNESVDKQHSDSDALCSILSGTTCDNRPMKDFYPSTNAMKIFSLLDESNRENKNSIKSNNACTDRTTNTNTPSTSHISLSQPSNESASYVVVTNASNLEDTDGDAQSQQRFGDSSQIMDDAPHLLDLQNDPEMIQSTSSARPDSNHTSQHESSTQAPPHSRSTNSPDNASIQQGNSSTSYLESNSVSDGRQQPNDGNSEESNEPAEPTSYERLGIIVSKPKRQDFAVLANRVKSFENWPKDHHLLGKDLALAGYFYTGYSDCARCFYCGGGLRNWEKEDDVWVEHAHWFPKCSYLFQEVGRDFIEAVQAIVTENKMNKNENATIHYDDVMKRIGNTVGDNILTYTEKTVERDPAVMSVVDNGFNKKDICQLALDIRTEGGSMSADVLYQRAVEKHLKRRDTSPDLSSDSVSIRKGRKEHRDQETISKLRNENNELRSQTNCKICMDKEVAVVFLPCGHFLSCSSCSSALSACPLCRTGIKGIVRAFMG